MDAAVVEEQRREREREFRTGLLFSSPSCVHRGNERANEKRDHGCSVVA